MSLILEHVILFTVWCFIFGAVIGSFLNVVILRHESGKTLTGRSECPRCSRTLTWKELVPILSYLVQGGKCKDCKERISYQYPFVEFATGTLFALVFLTTIADISPTFNLQPLTYAKLLIELCIWSLLVVITVYDLRTKLIPNVFSYSFATLAFIHIFLAFSFSLLDFLAGPLLFLPFYLLWKLSDGKWMGLGDGKLALGIGWFLGLELGGSAIIMSFWMGAAVSLALIAYQKIRTGFVTSNLEPRTPNLTLKSEIPFGPFMVLGTLYVYLLDWSILTFIY